MGTCHHYGPACSERGEASVIYGENQYCRHHGNVIEKFLGERGEPMPEPETVIETETENDKFPELRIARRIGNLMEQIEDGTMRRFILSWLQSRYFAS